MIKVDKIQIKEFRGIRNLSLDFNGENYAVCGPNGTGKSGVVDAIEFALTGSISRLSGEGMGNVSVKEHAPHVDSRNNPEKACVTVVLRIPALGDKKVTINRSVKNASSPIISPSSPEIISFLSQFNGHPEFVLSRREIIRYVISKPGNRSEEVQALLRFNQIGELRSNLLKISNAYNKEADDLKRVKIQAGENMARALEITELGKEKILKSVNSRRIVLGLDQLTELAITTNLNDGLETSSKVATIPRVNKTSALADIKIFSDTLQKIANETIKKECIELHKEISILKNNPIASESVSREKFLRTAIEFVTEAVCPVCDTKWDKPTLQSIIRKKLIKYEESNKKRLELERRLGALILIIDGIENNITFIEKIAKALAIGHLTALSAYRTTLATQRKAMKDFFPLADTISAVEKIYVIPENIKEIIISIEKIVTGIPEPTQQEAARDYIIRAQDRLENYRMVAREAEKAKQRAELTRKIYDVYTDVSNKALEGIYKDVEDDFSELYRSINTDDEGSFSAKLIPSIGKLGFNVDFYGRGHFPPGAYHSEGHQDAMGLCLYLALMRKLQGDNFKFAVLDDVLMSVDSAHRREVCNLLKQKYSDTQFILTTHDEVWLKLMATVGLIKPNNSTRFSNWTPDHGPAEWRTRDVWAEIDTAMKNNDVHTAASLLRYYLEHVFREVCDNLHAKVEFKGDGRYELGDMVAPAVRCLRDLILDGAKVAEAWKKTDVAQNLKAREESIKSSLLATNAEQWQVNSAIHYNEWANFSANDFSPVIAAFHDLVKKFFCEKPECVSPFYLITTSTKTKDSIRCSCGNTNINLKKPKS